MYYIEQLKSKDLQSLQNIAQELSIANAKSLSKEDLIYRILDEQAFINSQSGAPAVVKEENRMNRRNHRRNRITQEAGSKVYTATGDKAVKLDKTEGKRTQPKAESEAIEEKPIIAEKKAEEVIRVTPEPKATEPATIETPAPAEAEPAAEKAEQPAAKKRGRKPKAKQSEQPTAEEATATKPEEAATPVETEGKFIPIEELPVEKGETPTELINKFAKKEQPARNEKTQRQKTKRHVTTHPQLPSRQPPSANKTRVK